MAIPCEKCPFLAVQRGKTPWHLYTMLIGAFIFGWMIGKLT